jgi:hypothetical protein
MEASNGVFRGNVDSPIKPVLSGFAKLPMLWCSSGKAGFCRGELVRSRGTKSRAFSFGRRGNLAVNIGWHCTRHVPK